MALGDRDSRTLVMAGFYAGLIAFHFWILRQTRQPRSSTPGTAASQG